MMIGQLICDHMILCDHMISYYMRSVQSLPIDETMFDSQQQQQQQQQQYPQSTTTTLLTTVQLEQSKPRPSSDHVQQPDQDRSQANTIFQQQSLEPNLSDHQKPSHQGMDLHESK